MYEVSDNENDFIINKDNNNDIKDINNINDNNDINDKPNNKRKRTSNAKS